MKILKKLFIELPEYLLIAAVLFYWISSAVVLNPIAIALILGLILQIIFKSRVVGVIIPAILILASFYMLLALLSEFNEFPSFTVEAQKLLFVGLSFFGLTILVSGGMLYKYSGYEVSSSQKG